jgi:hypothetical protein
VSRGNSLELSSQNKVVQFKFPTVITARLISDGFTEPLYGEQFRTDIVIHCKLGYIV